MARVGLENVRRGIDSDNSAHDHGVCENRRGREHDTPCRRGFVDGVTGQGKSTDIHGIVIKVKRLSAGHHARAIAGFRQRIAPFYNRNGDEIGRVCTFYEGRMAVFRRMIGGGSNQ